MNIVVLRSPSLEAKKVFRIKNVLHLLMEQFISLVKKFRFIIFS